MIFFSIPAYANLKQAISSYKQSEKSRQEQSRQLNTKDNYVVHNCEDQLNENIINLKCTVSVKLAGEYIVKGRLYKNDPAQTGYDEMVLESHPNKFIIDDNITINIPFIYRHIARNKTIPNGPYKYEVVLIPSADLKNKLNTYTYGGFSSVGGKEEKETEGKHMTKFYNGEQFEELPFNDPYIL